MFKHVLDLISTLLLECWVDIKVIPEWTTGKLQRRFSGTCKAPKRTCLHIGDLISWKSLDIQIQTMPDALIAENQRLATCSY